MMEELTRDNEGLVGAANDEAPGHADGDADVLKKSYSDTHSYSSLSVVLGKMKRIGHSHARY